MVFYVQRQQAAPKRYSSGAVVEVGWR